MWESNALTTLITAKHSHPSIPPFILLSITPHAASWRDAFTFLVVFLIVYLDHYNRNTLFQGTPSSSISNLNSAFTFVLGFEWLWAVVLLPLFALGIRKGLLINDDDDDPVVLLWNCGRNVTVEKMESDSLQCSAMYPSRTLSSILRTPSSCFFRLSFLLF